MSAPHDPVRFGKLTGHYGVKGWFKVYAYTRPLEAVLDYRQWWIENATGWRVLEVEAARVHGKGVIARIAGINDRETAEPLLGSAFFVQRGDMPAAEKGSYYWADLIGLTVVNLEGESLGQIDHLFETGANDVIVVREGSKERLIPWLRPDVVKDIDLVGSRMTVDWDSDF